METEARQFCRIMSSGWDSIMHSQSATFHQITKTPLLLREMLKAPCLDSMVQMSETGTEAREGNFVK